MDPDAMEHDTTSPEPEELALVERLWRSGSSATAVSPSTRHDHRLLTQLLTTDDRSSAVPMLRRHRVATWRFASVVTLDIARADAAVEAAWQELLSEQPTSIGTWTNPRAWLFATTRRHALAQGPTPQEGVDLRSDTASLPFDPTGDIALLAASFCLLDEPARAGAWLHAVEGFEAGDIGHVLGINRIDAAELTLDAMDELRAAAMRGMQATAAPRCEAVLGSFDDYLAERIDADDERALLTHLGRCRRCAARLDAMEAPGLSLIDRVLAPPPALTARLRELTSRN